MKNLKYISILLVVAFLSSCSPSIDVRDMASSLPKAEAKIDASDPNQPILSVNDESVFTANWDFGNGILLQGKEVQGFFPIKGDYNYTLTAINSAGHTVSTGSINVPTTNLALLPPEFLKLVGSDPEKGKTWVYVDATNDDIGYCYMTANYDWEEAWWNPYTIEDGASPDVLNEMKFDLNGGFNFTRYETAGGTEEKGNFVFDAAHMTLSIVGSHIPDWNEENCDPDVTSSGVYYVKILDEDTLLLWQDQSSVNPDDFDYGWAWKFKAK